MGDGELYEKDLFGDVIKPQAASVVAQRFGFPPFSVLDAKTGDWQERKRLWLGIGIRSEVGRGAKAYNIVPGDYAKPGAPAPKEERLLLAKSSGTDFYAQKRKIERELGRELTTAEFQENYYEERSAIDNGTSVFDPVLCELSYSWFCPPGGQIIDPFAGGSVRGIVAGALDRDYWGCDLRAEQVAANVQQAKEISTPRTPAWVCGDSSKMVKEAPAADFVFSCPPYGDLEVYSEDPADLSRMDWMDFAVAYERIIALSVDRLKDNRFACFVVGDFRDNRGHYRNFVGKTVEAFEKAGARYYNEGILLTSVGSAAMRVTRQFAAGRKFAKTHQNILVFVKGDWRKAAEAVGDVRMI